MVIFDSVLKKKVEFIPQDPQNVKIYVCGPTVYDDAHLGHAKSSVSFDLLRRVLIALGYGVKFVKNYTDIDDKILKKMEESGKNLEEITNFYIKRYDDDMCALGVLRPDIAPLATQTLDEIIDYISALEKRNFTYTLSDGVYFDTTKDSGYFAISGKSDENNIARVQSNSQKRDAKDFVLWKFDDKFYPSPFGRGRPGWHSECVAMIQKYLDSGDKFSVDIHAGGADLLFPHHENEIAQSECCNGVPFANYWMHNGYITIDNEKMSKSKGNFFTVRDILKDYSGEVIRFFLLSGHYRSPINFSDTLMEQAKSGLERLHTCRENLNFQIKEGNDGEISQSENDTLRELETYENEFISSMDDDLNTADGISAIFQMVTAINKEIANGSSKAFAEKALEKMMTLCSVLGLLQDDEEEDFGEDIMKLVNERQEARKSKDFKRADEIRDKLASRGITLKDTPQGVQIIRETN